MGAPFSLMSPPRLWALQYSDISSCLPPDSLPPFARLFLRLPISHSLRLLLIFFHSYPRPEPWIFCVYIYFLPQFQSSSSRLFFHVLDFLSVSPPGLGNHHSLLLLENFVPKVTSLAPPAPFLCSVTVFSSFPPYFRKY